METGGTLYDLEIRSINRKIALKLKAKRDEYELSQIEQGKKLTWKKHPYYNNCLIQKFQ